MSEFKLIDNYTINLVDNLLNMIKFREFDEPAFQKEEVNINLKAKPSLLHPKEMTKIHYCTIFYENRPILRYFLQHIG